MTKKRRGDFSRINVLLRENKGALPLGNKAGQRYRLSVASPRRPPANRL
jgi:hypothetical protein